MDGSGPHDDVVNAGWGVAIWTRDSDSSVPECELFGPVLLKSWDKRWLGADRPTNNVGELTAMGDPLLWLLEEAPGDAHIPAYILYDSEYAYHAITSSGKPEANEKLILNIRDILSKVTVNRVLHFSHVRAHTGVTGNEFADHLAGQGTKGLQTTSSKRWIECCDAPAQVPAILTDHCWRCGEVFTGPSHARSLAGHEAHCVVPGAPPPFICCRHGWVRSSNGSSLRVNVNSLIMLVNFVTPMSVSVGVRTCSHAHALFAKEFILKARPMTLFSNIGKSVCVDRME